VDIVEAAIKDAVEKGAKVILGGKRNAAMGGTRAGLFLLALYYLLLYLMYILSFLRAELPQVCTMSPLFSPNVTHAMRVANEESFGPIMPIIKFKYVIINL